MGLADYIAETGKMVESALDIYLPPSTAQPQRIHQAMRYTVFAGGKRLRPLLLLMAAEATGGTLRQAMPAACAVELVHTYSLIHDDLPSMDNDDLRRGQPTCHKAFDEATAILAGDALLTWSFWLLAEELPRLGVPPQVVVSVIRELGEAAGVQGLIGGQVADLAAEGRKVDENDLLYIHRNKTAALFSASLRMGGMLADAEDKILAALGAFGVDLGMAFQIIDDILDVVGDESLLGKTPGSDERLAKSTFPRLLGLDEAGRRVEEYTRAALADLEPLGTGSHLLREMALHLLKRDH